MLYLVLSALIKSKKKRTSGIYIESVMFEKLLEKKNCFSLEGIEDSFISVIAEIIKLFCL